MGKIPVWRVNTPQLLREILNNGSIVGILSKPLAIFAELLAAVADRAIELNDPKLNHLMMRLALFEQGDPYSKGYDPDFYDASEQAAQDYVEPFPNGFTSWQETHYEVCSHVGYKTVEYRQMFDNNSADLRDACKEWTDEFELLHQGREWDGEWMDEVSDFVESKLVEG